MAAALEEKQVGELNKNVKSIVKILDAAVGNTATQKSKQNKEEKLVDRKEDLLDKEEKVIKKGEGYSKERQAQLYSLGSFIRAETDHYFRAENAQLITWSGMFATIGMGIKEWFNSAKERDTMLGRTLRLGASMWKATQDHIIGAMRNIWGKVTGQLQEVLGEVGEVFNVVKDAFMSAFNFIKDSFLGAFRKVPPHDRKRNKFLQEMVGYMRRDEKRDLLGIGKGESELPGLIFAIALVAAALLGGMVRRFLMPFEFISKGLKLGAKFRIIKNWLLSIKTFANIIFKIKWNFIKFGRWIAELWGKASGFLKFLPKLAEKLGMLFNFAKFGFKVLGWPLAIIIGVIDFIRGFMKSDSKTIIGKVIDGLKFAFTEFFDLPVKFIGWLVEKILGMFGVKVEGVAGKIMDKLLWIFEVGTGWIRAIGGLIEGFIEGGPIEGLKRFFEGITNMFKTLISIFPESMQNMIVDFFVMLGDFFVMLWDKFKGLLKFFGVDVAEPGGGQTPITTGGAQSSNSFSEMTDAEAKQESEKRVAAQEAVRKAIEKSTDKQIEANKKIAEESNDATAIALGGNAQTSPGEQNTDFQLKDEIDAMTMPNTNF